MLCVPSKLYIIPDLVMRMLKNYYFFFGLNYFFFLKKIRYLDLLKNIRTFMDFFGYRSNRLRPHSTLRTYSLGTRAFVQDDLFFSDFGYSHYNILNIPIDLRFVSLKKYYYLQAPFLDLQSSFKGSI